MQKYDVVIVGASFSGLALAHHLPDKLSVLIVDQKPSVGASVESTGLITTKTYNEFKTFFDIDRYITNSVKGICVVAPDFKDHFISTVAEPWIYQTDTRGLVRAMAETIPQNVTVKTGVMFRSVEKDADGLTVALQSDGKVEEIHAGFLVGADGSRSCVAKEVDGLDVHEKFLFAFEKVIYGDILLGNYPEETIYHFWFGPFSLGYGGWISPTFVEDRPAFRIGLAKHMRDKGEAIELLDKFLERLIDEEMIRVDDADQRPAFAFGGVIPIDGALQNIFKDNILLIGDAAGYCGAFAADGIKGSIVSGKEAAGMISDYFAGNKDVSLDLNEVMESKYGLISYYKKQLKYRWLWDQMKRDRTFTAMFRLVKKESESFLDQFCDSKDRMKGLSRTVLRFKYTPLLVIYAFYVVWDMLFESWRK